MVYFFNYGEPFVNAQAEEMLCYIKSVAPDAHVVTSTNGIPLAKPARAKRVAESGVDCMVFTIGGITQESYEKYHVLGRADLALRGMTNVLRARSELGAKLPYVNWRYLLFRWNDSEEEVEQAIAIAKEHGVDAFDLYLTHIPYDGCSYRFSPGSPLFAKYRPYIGHSLGYTARVLLPDDDGFYAAEVIEPLGAARWMCWQARLSVESSGGWIHLSLGTLRPSASERPNHVFVVTPWRTLKLPVGSNTWNRYSIPIPEVLRDLGEISAVLVTDDYWFPAEEIGTQDLRCLGSLVTQEEPWGAEILRRWMNVEAAPPPSPAEVLRFSQFKYVAPEPLRDWNSGRVDDSGRALAQSQQLTRSGTPPVRPPA